MFCSQQQPGEMRGGINIKDGSGDRVLTVGFLLKRWWIGLALE